MCPRKIHQGPFLKRLFNNIYAKDCFHEYSQILKSVDGPRKVFAKPLRKNCTVVCNVHLEHFLMENAETDCISEEGEKEDEQMSEFYPFKVFNNE